MDFVSHHTASGRRFRILTIVDQVSRRCPAVLVNTSITGIRTTRFLDGVAALTKLPEVISVDNNAEFISNALDQWASARGVRLCFSRPGEPVDNAYVESFNGRFRDECLNANWFRTVD